jgi:hypothetical protein
MRLYKFLDAEYGLKNLRHKRLKISLLDDLNDPFELAPFEMRKRNIRSAYRGVLAGYARMFGLVCFSKSWRDPVIWGHYSDKHKGICLGFEVPERLCRRVQYKKRRLRFPKDMVLGRQSMLFTKYVNWAYEKEWRCFRPLLDGAKSGGLYFMNFGDDLKLVRVIVGARSKITEHEIRRAVEPLKDVRIIKARAGFRRFEIVKDRRGFRETQPSPAV